MSVSKNFIAGFSLEEYEKKTEKAVCPVCGTSLKGARIRASPADDGWTVKGMDKKQWLSKTCPKCLFATALWKIGVPRL